MRISHPLLGAVVALGLAGCMAYEPVSQDKQGRSVLAGAQAAKMFVDGCYNSPNGRAVQRSSSYTSKTNILDGVSADHKTISADFVALESGGCMFSFVGNKPAAESAAEATAALMSQLKVTGVGGKKGGGQINLSTAKGRVIVGNGSKRHPQGFSIMYFRR